MSHHPPDATLPPEPTRWSAWVFLFKARCFQARRLVTNFLRPVKKFGRVESRNPLPVAGEWSSDLWRGGESPRERHLQLGKVQNLRVAARDLNGLEIPADAIWSFWKHLGRTTAARGYSEGRELREGCLIPQIGGGLCQLSGAIYNAALEAGLEIVERHAHSNSTIGSLAKMGRDATIFWNYVDLRLRHTAPWRLEVELSEDQLHVSVLSAEKHTCSEPAQTPSSDSRPINACATCGLTSCHRSSPLDASLDTVDRTAVLVDAWWPEWDVFFQSGERTRRDLLLPMDGKRWRKASYLWDTALHASSRSFPWLALRRAWATRRLRNEGARRQQELLHWDERLAACYGRALKARHSHLVISQTLLPWLWQQGWLGGRTYDVLMTRLPLQVLQTRLDEAAQRHPQSGTCADFRASPALVEAETTALSKARQWITPHAEIAKLAGTKANLIPWSTPRAPGGASASPAQTARVVFPASTLCRKGAYVLREALRDLPVTLEPLGGVLEGADFWDGFDLAAPGSPAGWTTRADIVVMPAYVEHCPRSLLHALAHGIPVIATPACGLGEHASVIEVAAGDPAALRSALITLLSKSRVHGTDTTSGKMLTHTP